MINFECLCMWTEQTGETDTHEILNHKQSLATGIWKKNQHIFFRAIRTYFSDGVPPIFSFWNPPCEFPWCQSSTCHQPRVWGSKEAANPRWNVGITQQSRGMKSGASARDYCHSLVTPIYPARRAEAARWKEDGRCDGAAHNIRMPALYSTFHWNTPVMGLHWRKCQYERQGNDLSTGNTQ